MGRIDRRLLDLERQLASVYEDPKERFARELRRRILDSFSLIELCVMLEVNEFHARYPDLSPAQIYALLTDTQRAWPNFYFERVRRVLEEMLDEDPDLDEETRSELRRVHRTVLGSHDFYKKLAEVDET